MKELAKSMQKLVTALEELPWIVRLLLTILYGAYGNLLRLARSLAKEDIAFAIVAVILLLAGGLIVLWIFDIVCVAMGKKIWWVD